MTQQMPMKIPLKNYQIYAKDFMIRNPFCGLFLRMGLGKTSIVLEGLYELDPHDHVLVIAPKTIAISTWSAEIKKWNIPFRTKSLIVNEKGKMLTKKKREQLYEETATEPPTLYFINRELTVNIVTCFEKQHKPWPFKTIIVDESQSFKSYNSERFKALTKIRTQIQRMVLLTGSPTPKGLMDLWSQIYLLDMGYRLGPNITAYRNNFFYPTIYVDNHPVDWKPRPDATDIIYNKIQDIVISMKNKQLKLPSITYNNVIGYMTDSELKKYKQFMKNQVLEITPDTKIKAANAAVLSAKLSQLASGAIYKETGSHDYYKFHTHKLDLCKYIIDNTDGPVIIAYHFQSDLEMLSNFLSQENIDYTVFTGTPDMVEQWNKRQLPVILLQPASCGFGLNLQEGGETLIWYTMPWSLEQYEQTNARIYRQGQKNPVIIHHLMMAGTIDDKLLTTLHKKDTSQRALLDAVEATFYDGM